MNYNPTNWEIVPAHHDQVHICIDIGKEGCVLVERHKEGHDQDDMNAAFLIAAAPDLLCACENLLLEAEANNIHAPTRIALAKSAIKKARGKY